MSDLREATWDRMERAKELGCVVIEPDKRTLLLDLDSEEQLARFNELKSLINELFGINKIERWVSSSGEGHWHVRVMLDSDLEPAQAIALQAALGSDPTREILGIRRIHQNIEYPSLLFQPEKAEIETIYDTDDLFGPSL